MLDYSTTKLARMIITILCIFILPNTILALDPQQERQILHDEAQIGKSLVGHHTWSTPEDLATAIDVDPAILIAASFSGNIEAAAIFPDPTGLVDSTGAFLNPIAGDTYLILSTGVADNIFGDPSDFESTDFGLVAPDGSRDLASLTLTLIVPGTPGAPNTLSFNFRFMSEEYPEWVGTQYNDFFRVFLTTPSGTQQIAFDTNGNPINVNNNFFDPAIYPAGTKFDGTTPLLTTMATVTGGDIITLTFEVADMGDNIYDTAVFIDNLRFSEGGEGPPVTGAFVTISGTIRWTDSAGNTHPVRFAPVEIRDKEDVGSELVATTVTDANGFYSVVINNDDGIDQNGRDIFIRVFARSTGFDIRPQGSTNTYFLESDVIPDVADGSVWSIDITANNTDEQNTAFAIADALVTASRYVQNLTGSIPSLIEVNFPSTLCGASSCYSNPNGIIDGDETLNITGRRRFSQDTIHHEYGHYVSDVYNLDANPGGTHTINCGWGKDHWIRFAWGEGWPTYFGTSLQQVTGAISFGIPYVGDTRYTAHNFDTNVVDFWYDLESTTGAPSRGEDDEISVQRILWDLFDSSSDAGDNVNLGDVTIWNILTGATPHTLSAAWNAFIAGRPILDQVRFGAIFSEHNVAPDPTTPPDETVVGTTPPTFEWDANGGVCNDNDRFTVEFYNSDFSSLIFTSAEISTNNYTPAQTDWETIISASNTINWIVRARNTAVPETGIYISRYSSVDVLNLSIQKWGPWWVGLGRTMWYGIYYESSGFDAQDVVIEDTLPPQVSYVSSTGGSYNPSTHTVTWNLGTVSSGTQDYLSISVYVPFDPSLIGAVLQNCVDISTSDEEPILDDNQSCVTTTVMTAWDPNDKLVSPLGDVWPGETINYTVRYENAGNIEATGVYITDKLDEDLDDSTLIINDGGTYDPSTRTITWNIGTVPPNTGGSVGFSINVKDDVPAGTVVSNFGIIYFPDVPQKTLTNIVTNTVAPLPSQGSVSGGAYLYHAGYRASLSLDITSDGTVTSGWLKYYYTKTRMYFLGTEISSLIISGNTATINGVGKVNNVPGYTFTATVVDGSPDSFTIAIYDADGNQYYANSGNIIGGDLKILP
jgi:hypothetical protein